MGGVCVWLTHYFWWEGYWSVWVHSGGSVWLVEEGSPVGKQKVYRSGKLQLANMSFSRYFQVR